MGQLTKNIWLKIYLQITNLTDSSYSKTMTFTNRSSDLMVGLVLLFPYRVEGWELNFDPVVRVVESNQT